MIGKTISHFRILEKLGEGGMGVVYKAEDTRLQRTVALKFISRQMLGSDEVAARFIREAQAAAACEHANVCTIYEVDDSDEGTFIAMAYVEGETLKDRIAPGAVVLNEAIDTAIQIARGLNAAHSRGIVHRDIKPGNIMMTPDGVAKVMDFGLARPPEATQLTRRGSTVGTIAYMSPEQTRGREVDERSDIWALGVVLYEMVTGRRPFRGDYDQAVMYSILNEEPDPMTDAQPGIPAELERIVSKTLAKSPGERYQRVEEMLGDLCALRGGVADLVTTLLTPKGANSTRTNLPLQLTSFIGRDEAVVEVRRLLSVNRFLTLTGAGGCGKTRLALEVGGSLLDDFADGVWLVELAPLREPELVPQAVVTALRLMQATSRAPTEALVDYLKRRSLLLVLDNCEHLLATCSELVDKILRSCSDVRLLATSREPLAIMGETILQVPSLAVPASEDHLPLDELAEVESVRLFVERAAAVKAGFSLTGENAPAVGEICRRLDGMPLALELASARIKVLPATEIARRLEDRFRLLSSGARVAPPRHQTLKALVDWSYEQLSEREQMLLARLSVFAGGWSLDSVEAVCAGGGIERQDVLELMSSLVEKSLVETLAGPEAAGARYRMHETIREYGRDHLSDDEGRHWTKRHRDHFVEVAEEAEPHLRGGTEQVAWFRRLAAEHDNLRAALGVCMGEDGDGVLGLRLAGALARYWEIRGHWNEGRRTCARLLALPVAHERTAAQAKVLRCAGVLALLQYDYSQAGRLFEGGLAASRELEDPQSIADSLRGLAMAVHLQGDDARARSLCEESLAIALEHGDKWQIAACLEDGARVLGQEENRLGRRRVSLLEALRLFRELGDRCGEGDALHRLGFTAANRGDRSHAVSLLDESLSAYQELDNPRGVAHTLLTRAGVAVDQGDLGRARDFSEESLLLTRRLGHPGPESLALATMGEVARLEGNLERARLLLEESLSIARKSSWAHEADALRILGHVCLDRGEYERARALLAKSLVLRWGHMDSQACVVLERLGMLAAATGAHARTARLLGATERLREESGYHAEPVETKQMDRRISAARRELGEQAFEQEWALGRAMSTDQAVEYALSADGESDSPAAQGGSGQEG